MARRTLRSITNVALCAALAACGGNTGDTTGATGASSTTASSPALTKGTVTGFGSVIVDGERISDAGATVEVQGDAGLAAKGLATDVKLGQRVEVDRDADGKALTIHIAPELIGLVTAIDASAHTVTVNTIAIGTNTDAANGPVTTYDGYTQFSDIAVGDRVEVHGSATVEGSGKIAITATRIEQKPMTTAVVVTGPISDFSSTGKTFKLAGLTVTFGDATRLLPTGATLADGERVTVLAANGVNAGAIDATAIRVRKAPGTSETIRVAGLISGLVSGGTTLKIGDLAVDASKAKITPASGSLGNGQYAIAVGTVDTATGTLDATEVHVIRGLTTLPVELHGTITDFTSASAFKLRGVLVDASAAKIRGGVLADLADNVAVEVHGNVVDNVVEASTVDIQKVSDQDVADITGVVQKLDPTTKVLTLTLRNGAPFAVNLTDASVYMPNGKTIDSLTIGTLVRVHGHVVSGALTADLVVVFGAADSAAPHTVTGGVHDIAPSTGTPESFRIEGLTIRVGSATLPQGFANGVRVLVQFTVSNGVFTATSIALAP